MNFNITMFFLVCFIILTFSIVQPIKADFSETPSDECTAFITPSDEELGLIYDGDGEPTTDEISIYVGMSGHHCCRAMERLVAGLIEWEGVQACCDETWPNPNIIQCEEVTLAVLSCGLYSDPTVLTLAVEGTCSPTNAILNKIPSLRNAPMFKLFDKTAPLKK